MRADHSRSRSPSPELRALSSKAERLVLSNGPSGGDGTLTQPFQAARSVDRVSRSHVPRIGTEYEAKLEQERAKKAKEDAEKRAKRKEDWD